MLGLDGPLDQRGEVVHAEITRRRRHGGLCIDNKLNGKGTKSGTGRKSRARMVLALDPGLTLRRMHEPNN